MHRIDDIGFDDADGPLGESSQVSGDVAAMPTSSALTLPDDRSSRAQRNASTTSDRGSALTSARIIAGKVAGRALYAPANHDGAAPG
jgi:hypothetical protein